MALTTAATAQIVKTYKRSKNDTGSPEVQIALLTTRINGALVLECENWLLPVFAPSVVLQNDIPAVLRLVKTQLRSVPATVTTRPPSTWMVSVLLFALSTAVTRPLRNLVPSCDLALT